MPASPDEDALDKYEIRKPSRWRWLKRLAVSVSITLAIYFAWQFGNREWTKRQGARELAAARAEAADDDPDWQWDRLRATRPEPPAGKNGAELVPRVKALTRAGWGKAQLDPQLKTLLEAEPNRRFPPEALTALRAELAESADAVALARTMKDRPFGRRELVLTPDVLNTRLEDTQNTRHVADLLRWDAVVALEEGDPERATGVIAAMLNTSRSIGEEPFLISQLVRIAVRILTIRALERVLAQLQDAPNLAELQTALAGDAEEPLLLYGLRGERAAYDRLFENLANGSALPENAIDSSFKKTEARVGWWHYRVNLLSDRAYYLSWMTRCVGHARRPIHDQPPLFADLPVPPDEKNRMLSRLLLPAAERLAHASWRATAEARCAVAGIACERFRQQHMRWPDSLVELVPAFLPALPLDPFDGQPLRFTKSDTGAAVYCVGKRLAPQFDLKTTPPITIGLPEGIEFGFRLYNPDQRRLPPAEPPAPEPAP